MTGTVEFLTFNRDVCDSSEIPHAKQVTPLLWGCLGLFAKTACLQLLMEGTGSSMIPQVGRGKKAAKIKPEVLWPGLGGVTQTQAEGELLWWNEWSLTHEWGRWGFAPCPCMA